MAFFLRSHRFCAINEIRHESGVNESAGNESSSVHSFSVSLEHAETEGGGRSQTGYRMFRPSDISFIARPLNESLCRKSMKKVMSQQRPNIQREEDRQRSLAASPSPLSPRPPGKTADGGENTSHRLGPNGPFLSWWSNRPFPSLPFWVRDSEKPRPSTKRPAPTGQSSDCPDKTTKAKLEDASTPTVPFPKSTRTFVMLEAMKKLLLPQPPYDPKFANGGWEDVEEEEKEEEAEEEKKN
uniref:Uncharacterized protein n=1 Tax=Globodera rostochiensis TaxID=31243 RepID=A0A914HA15_GLORO